MTQKRMTKQQEIAGLLADVFGPGDYDEAAARFASWDMGSPRGVLTWLRHYQNEGMIPKGGGNDRRSETGDSDPP